MQSPDIKAAKITDKYIIQIIFATGEVKQFDIRPYLRYPIFKPLENINELQSFQIVDGTIEWSCGADLSPDTFYIESKPLDKDAVM